MKWWHDSADKREVVQALSQCACGVTTNPVLAYQALQSDPTIRESLSGTGLPGSELLLKTVVQRIAEVLLPVYEQTEGKHGYVCAQVDPQLAANPEQMLEMARRFHSWAPNIAVKLPVTKEGLEVLEECVAEGITTVGTVSFTVPQVLAVGASHMKGSFRALRNGKKPGHCFAVIMIGRLDDYLLDIVQGTDLDASTVRHAGIATVKRAYSLFLEREFEALLLVAALRGSYHIEHLTGGKLVLSIHPKYQAILMNDRIPRIPDRIREPVDRGILGRLLKVKEFRQAYEIDGMKPERFISYGATQRTLAQFIHEGWLKLASFGDSI
jgi:transaldolase